MFRTESFIRLANVILLHDDFWWWKTNPILTSQNRLRSWRLGICSECFLQADEKFDLSHLCVDSSAHIPNGFDLENLKLGRKPLCCDSYIPAAPMHQLEWYVCSNSLWSLWSQTRISDRKQWPLHCSPERVWKQNVCNERRCQAAGPRSREDPLVIWLSIRTQESVIHKFSGLHWNHHRQPIPQLHQHLLKTEKTYRYTLSKCPSSSQILSTCSNITVPETDDIRSAKFCLRSWKCTFSHSKRKTSTLSQRRGRAP